MLKRYYFTFGTAPEFPFCGGWVIVVAPDFHAAAQVFKAYYPSERDPGILNCADYYSEESFQETEIAETGNFGAFCHEIIEPRKPGEIK